MSSTQHYIILVLTRIIDYSQEIILPQERKESQNWNRRRKAFFFIGAIVLVVIAFISIDAKQSQASTNGIENVKPTEQQIQNASKSTGIPAITTQSNTSAVAGSVRFTETDVRTYLHTHPFPDAPVVNGASQTIRNIQFVTMKEAKIITKDRSLSSDPNAIVCLATLYGPFSLPIGLLPPGLQARGWRIPSTIDTVYETFDGQTGNLLLLGIPAQPIPPKNGTNK